MSTLELKGRTYSTQEVIDHLKWRVTPERLTRLQEIIAKRDKNLVAVVENIYDRGNTSAVMRSAEAFGFHLFHQIISHKRFKESKRVTKGADKWLLQSQWRDTGECLKTLKEQGYKIYVTHLAGGKPISELSFSEPVALCFGNEREGASPTLTKMADERLYIPMQGFVQSFNISVAAALCFQHVWKEHQIAGFGPLSDDERQELLAYYLFRSCKKPGLGALKRAQRT